MKIKIMISCLIILIAGSFVLYKSTKTDIVIDCVSGKNISQIRDEFPVEFNGMTADNLQVYSSFQKDTICRNYFYFQNGICVREVIVPSSNAAMEAIVHYLNKNALEKVEGGKLLYSRQPSVPAKRIVGQWTMPQNKFTNIFMIAGEKENPFYFINTTEEEPR